MSKKFIKVAYQADMIKANVDGKDDWFFCSKAVKDFAKKNFSEGDEVEFEYSVKKNDKNKDENHIEGYVKKVGGASSPATSSSESSKDNGGSSSYQNSKYKADPEKSESIRKQCCAKATADTLVALQGHVDPNNVFDLMDEIYKKYDSLTK